MKELQRVPLRLDLDPSWGKLAMAKDDAIAHAARITPASNPKQEYNLLLLIPNLAYIDDGVGLAKVIFSLFLEQGDKFKMVPINKDKISAFCVPGTAIISFDPNCDTDYFWLQPPTHETN